MKSAKLSLILVFTIFATVIATLIITSNFDMPIKGATANQSEKEQSITLGSSQPVSRELLGLESLSKAFVQVAKEVNPSVVTINSQSVIKMRRHPFLEDEFFRRFFRFPDEEEQIRRGLGSGVIVNPDGYILTNNHVVSEADEITVTFEKQEYDAEIIGTDPLSDLAVIKIDKKGLPTAKLGNSESLEVGEWVLAIGNPFSDVLQNTVTAGIVSAKGRSKLPISGGDVTYQDFIQTDAAINPGNSGGALVNLRGELVGINTAILGQANIGIGFAIPIDMAKNVMEQLINEGKVVRGYLGLLPQPVDEDMARAFNLDAPKGALVAEVVEDGPSAKAGVKVEDIILKMNGEDIRDDDHLRNLTASFAPNTKVTLLILRDGKEKEIVVKLGERPTETADIRPKEESARSKLGFEVQNLTDELAERLGLEGESGILVSDVKRGSEAQRKGLSEGDLITSVNRKAVNDVREFNRIIDGLKSGDIVLLRLKREQTSRFIALEVPKDE